MKEYQGTRKVDRCVVYYVEGEIVRPLPPRNDLYDHSPTGFEWGYGGSGPAQLALAILAHYLEDDAEAVRLHQAFKWKVVGNIRTDAWRLTDLDVAHGVAYARKRNEPIEEGK